ncbi:MAG: DUF554 domain-containing protein [Clostridia bacterium]|nr:DUF554 domain-containing protein [Clostridia bacterium]
MILRATILNALVVIIGSVLGNFLSKVFEKHPRLRDIPTSVMKAISVVVIVIGIDGALDSEKPIVLLISLVIGTVIGSIIDIDGLFEKLGKSVERRFVKNKVNPKHPELTEGRAQKSFSKAFVSTALTCCVGALAITGALESGLSGGANQELLYTKCVLDFVTAVVFSSAFGLGAAAASVVIFLYQGIIELCASGLSVFLAGSITEISAVGSVIVCALGLNMLGVTKIKIANMLPAVFLPILLCLFM